MKKFIFFYINGSRVLGSDGMCPVDGRLGMWRLKEFAAEQAHRKRFVKPGINGFKICQGEIRNWCESKSPLIPINQNGL